MKRTNGAILRCRRRRPPRIDWATHHAPRSFEFWILSTCTKEGGPTGGHPFQMLERSRHLDTLSGIFTSESIYFRHIFQNLELSHSHVGYGWLIRDKMDSQHAVPQSDIRRVFRVRERDKMLQNGSNGDKNSRTPDRDETERTTSSINLRSDPCTICVVETGNSNRPYPTR